MRTTPSLARRCLGCVLVALVPVFAAAVVFKLGVSVGLGEPAASVWAASASITHCLVIASVLLQSSKAVRGGVRSLPRIEILTDRVLTYYLFSGVWMGASFRTLALVSPAWGPLGWPLGGGFALLACPGYFFPRADHLRGRRLLSFGEACGRASRLLDRGDRGLPWGELRIPSRLAVLHFLLLGAPGSGKTLTIRMLAGEFVSRMGQGEGRRAIVYDAKRDMVSILSGMRPGVPVKILNPFDRRSTRWAIARDALSPAACMQIAEALIRTEEGPNQFFSLAGIEIVAGVMVALNLSCPGRWTLRDMILATRDPDRLAELLGRRPETRGALIHFAEERVLANILSTVRVRLAQLEPIAAAWDHAEDEVSLEEWAAGEMILILGNDETTRVCLDALNRVILRRSVELVLNGPEVDDWRTLYLLDEVAQAGKLDSLSSLLTKGRSKGASVVLGFQDMDGLRQVYDKGADELVGQCATKALLRIESPGTAEWASRVVGDAERWEHQVTTAPGGDSTTHQRMKREVVLPSEFLSLPPASRVGGVAGYFVVPEVGVFRRAVSPKTIRNLLHPKGPVPDFVPRPVEEQYLRPWGGDDHARLDLVDRDDAAPRTESEGSPSSPGRLRVVKKIAREQA
jgi:hypothetical protein